MYFHFTFSMNVDGYSMFVDGNRELIAVFVKKSNVYKKCFITLFSKPFLSDSLETKILNVFGDPFENYL